jgi:hypothetical protein
LMSEARTLLAQSLQADAELLTRAEETLLRTFCQYDLKAYQSDLTSYDLLFELFSAPGLAARKTYWQERLSEVYPPTQSQLKNTVRSNTDSEPKAEGILTAR